MRGSTLVRAFALAVVLAVPRAALADADAARQHFDAGKKLRDEGDCARAIPEFDKSLAADKSIGAYYNLAYCHEMRGDRQEAYEAYRQAQQLASSRHDDRTREIGAAIVSLLETPHIRLALPEAVPAGLEIRVDDQLVPSTSYQTETIVFTKPTRLHAVVVVAPDYEAWRASVETKQLRTVELHRLPAPVVAPPRPAESHDGWSWQRWTGLGVIGAGAAALTVGTILGIGYLNDESRLRNDFLSGGGCVVGDVKCNNDKTAIRAQYLDVTSFSHEFFINAVLIGGGLLAAAGIYVFVTAPDHPPPSTSTGALVLDRVTPFFDGSRGGVSATGTF